MFMTQIPVLWTPLSALHDPPHEILSGQLQPYFESPQRVSLILDSIFAHEECKTRFDKVQLDWEREEVGEDWVWDSLRAVHDEDYLEFLRDIYEEWIAEGGSKAAVLPEAFMHSNLRLDPAETKPVGAIQKAGQYSFDLSCPITAGEFLYPLLPTLADIPYQTHGSQPLRLLDLHWKQRSDYLRTLSSEPRSLYGHHSGPSLCGGYCYLNNAAIATRFLQSGRPGSKVAILDIDYHHGNGTSKVFYEDPSVLYVSLHGSPDYPYFTGAASERGSGKGLGTNVNFPLPRGTGGQLYLKTLKEACNIIQAFEGAEYLVVSLGVDAHVDDPLTDFRLELMDFAAIGGQISGLGLPTLFVMEGGYALASLGDSVLSVLLGFNTGHGQ